METRLTNVSIFVLFMLATTLIWTFPSVAQQFVPEFDLGTAVGIWLLDEGEGAIARDTSGNGNDGTLMGDTSEWVDGRFGKAINFNGHFVWVRNVVGLPVGGDPRTVMCSFKWHELMWKPEAERQDVSIGTGGIGIMGYGPIERNSRVTVWIDDHESVGVETCYDTNLTPWAGDTDWHHLAVVFPRGGFTTSDFRIYFDGEIQEAVVEGNNAAINTKEVNLNIGSQSGSNGMPFIGIIDDVAIFPSELHDEHIKSIARNGLVNALAVSPSGKLATSWGILKAR